jgi:hypothetical protein
MAKVNFDVNSSYISNAGFVRMNEFLMLDLIPELNFPHVNFVLQ